MVTGIATQYATKAVGKALKKSPQVSDEGVYDFRIKEAVDDVDQYIGQSQNMLNRVDSHFYKSGKFGNFSLKPSPNFYYMPGSTKLEREVFEQYLIKSRGLDLLLDRVK